MRSKVIVSSILVVALLGMNVAWANGWETVAPPSSTAQWHPKALVNRLDQYIRHRGRELLLDAVRKERPDLAISEQQLIELERERKSLREQLFLGAWFASIELFVTGMRFFVGTGVTVAWIQNMNLGIFLWPVVVLFTFTGSIARTVVLLVFKLRRPELRLGWSMLASLIPFYIGTGFSFLLFIREQRQDFINFIDKNNHQLKDQTAPVNFISAPNSQTMEMAI